MKYFLLMLLSVSAFAAEPAPAPSVAPQLQIQVPDELPFVDADIQAAFKGKVYYIGTPSMVQLAREVRLLREQLQKQAKKK